MAGALRHRRLCQPALLVRRPAAAEERRDSHKPQEFLELHVDNQLNLARVQPAKGASAAVAAAAATPRNSAATEADKQALAKDLLISPQGHVIQRGVQPYHIHAHAPGNGQLATALQGLSVSATPRNTAAAT